MSTIKRFYKHIVVFLFFITASIFGVNYFFDQQEKNYLSVQTDLLQNKYTTNYKYFKIMSSDIHLMYQDNKKLISIFSQAKDASDADKTQLNKQLYALLKKRYARLQNMGISKIHFILPDNTSFLRMHKKDKYGDDLSNIRKSVVQTNATKKAHEDFEIGVYGDGFRFIFPLFSKSKEYIGCVDIAYDPKQLLKNLTDKSVLERHFLVLSSLVKQNTDRASAVDYYSPSIENPDYLHRKETHHEAYSKKIQKVFNDPVLEANIAENIKTKKPFSIYGNYNYDSIAITFLPIINNVDKNVVAYLTLYTDADYLDMLLVEKYYTLTLLLSVLFLILLFSIYFSITQHKLERMAHFDKLTNLPNRAYFHIELELELKRAKRNKEKFSIMFIDLDGFKDVNDTYGHNVGDELLIQVSRTLEKVVRGVDIVSRIGGDEFVILITDIQSDEDSILVAKKIIAKLNEDFLINKNYINVGASIGIANYPTHGTDSSTLIKNSDNAMYEAKRNGKNNFSLTNLDDDKNQIWE